MNHRYLYIMAWNCRIPNNFDIQVLTSTNISIILALLHTSNQLDTPCIYCSNILRNTRYTSLQYRLKFYLQKFISMLLYNCPLWAIDMLDDVMNLLTMPKLHAMELLHLKNLKQMLGVPITTPTYLVHQELGIPNLATFIVQYSLQMWQWIATFT